MSNPVCRQHICFVVPVQVQGCGLEVMAARRIIDLEAVAGGDTTIIVPGITLRTCIPNGVLPSPLPGGLPNKSSGERCLVRIARLRR